MTSETNSDKVNKSGVYLDELIRQGETLFTQAELSYGHGTDNALDESAWLVLHAVGIPPDEPIDDYHILLSQQQSTDARALLQRRVDERQPAAYLTGSAWFAGLQFHVDSRVLVPRSPLAEPILAGFTPWLDPSKVRSVMDMCTGSGCIGIACAYAFADAKVLATDISHEALEVAAQNVFAHDMAERVELAQGSLFEPAKGRSFDLVISNPPYVDAADMAALSDEFKHEPELGLAAGEDGLDLVRTMLREAHSHLNPGGLLVIEVGNSAPALEAAYPQLPFFWMEFESGGEGVFMLWREDLQAIL
ncbi:MAG: 50S ribosomal protein L3 N(5)-glutamine methyltransferase [Granulosicoccaceae bacterium]